MPKVLRLARILYQFGSVHVLHDVDGALQILRWLLRHTSRTMTCRCQTVVELIRLGTFCDDFDFGCSFFLCIYSNVRCMISHDVCVSSIHCMMYILCRFFCFYARLPYLPSCTTRVSKLRNVGKQTSTNTSLV